MFLLKRKFCASLCLEMTAHRVFTLGYEKRNVESFIRILMDAGVQTVIDVRETPWSHKPGFSKSPFEAALAKCGIAYVHAKFAGNPKAIRSGFTNPEDCLRAYKQHLRKRPVIVDELADLIEEHPVPCLVCFERVPQGCHRGILAEALKKHGMSIRHLGDDIPVQNRLC